MSKTVSAHDAEAHFGALLDAVTENGEGDEVIIIERGGEPRAVLLSYDGFQHLQEVRERRAAMLADLEALEVRISARNREFPDEETIALAIDVSKDIQRQLIARAKERAAHDAG